MFTRAIGAALCVLLLHTAIVRAQSSLTELNKTGWAMIEQGDYARAARVFADALAQKPDEPAFLFGASVSAHLQGRASDAKPGLKRALQLNPRFTPASLLLGEILYREGDLDQAIKTYEKALSHAPANAALTERLAAWRKEADVHGSFIERRQDRFRVMFEGRTDAALAAQTTQTLNTAFWRIGQQLGAYPSDSIQVILYTQKQFRDITRAPEWSDGLYDGRIRVPVGGAARSAEAFESVLVHELAHAMVSAIAPRGVPVWLHEGLAQYVEGEDVETARRRLKAHGRRIPLAQLEGSFTGLTTAGAMVAYDESLVAVHTIVERRTVTWTQLLYALVESDRPSATLHGFGLAYADLEAAFER